MELALPMNYVEVTEEEMMYLDGGWTSGKFFENIISLGKKGGSFAASVLAIAKLLGKSGTAALKGFQASFSFIAGKISLAIGKLVGLIGGFWAGFLGGLGAGAAIWYLGENRVFY